MRIERADLDEAIAQQILTSPQAAALWRLLQSRQPLAAGVHAPAPEAPQRRFTGLNVAYYFGALLVISAMGWLMTLGWEAFGGKGIFLIATLYAFFFTMAGLRLLTQPQTRTPGGLRSGPVPRVLPLDPRGVVRDGSGHRAGRAHCAAQGEVPFPGGADRFRPLVHVDGRRAGPVPCAAVGRRHRAARLHRLRPGDAVRRLPGRSPHRGRLRLLALLLRHGRLLGRDHLDAERPRAEQAALLRDAPRVRGPERPAPPAHLPRLRRHR